MKIMRLLAIGLIIPGFIYSGSFVNQPTSFIGDLGIRISGIGSVCLSRTNLSLSSLLSINSDRWVQAISTSPYLWPSLIGISFAGLGWKIWQQKKQIARLDTYIEKQRVEITDLNQARYDALRLLNEERKKNFQLSSQWSNEKQSLKKEVSSLNATMLEEDKAIDDLSSNLKVQVAEVAPLQGQIEAAITGRKAIESEKRQ